MRRKLVVLSVVCICAALLAAGTGGASIAGARGPAAVHLAEISITKSRVKKQKIVVTTKISGLAIQGSGWRLEWKPKGKKRKKPKGKAVVKNNLTGKTAKTKRLRKGKFVVTVRLMDANGKPFKPSDFPQATLSAKKTVRVR